MGYWISVMVLQFLFGQVMKETKGRASPQVVKRVLAERLNAP